MSTQLRRSTKLAVCFLTLSFTGCAAISSRPDEPPPEQVQSDANCTLMFVSKDGERERVTCPLDGSPTIQKVLQAHGALRRYRRVIVRICRQKPDSPGSVWMDVGMDPSGQVKEEFNYAVHPGDKILVKEDPDGPMDDLLKKLGPLSRMAGY